VEVGTWVRERVLLRLPVWLSVHVKVAVAEVGVRDRALGDSLGLCWLGVSV